MNEKPPRKRSRDDGQKHHFVPIFYLSQWVTDGELTQYHRPRDEIIAERVPPARTGYERGLYAVPGVAPEVENEVEDVFLKRVDREAADVLQHFVSKSELEIPDRLRHSWARFLMTMLARHPVKIRENAEKAKAALEAEAENFQAEWETLRKPGEPENYLDAVKSLDPRFLDKFGARALWRLGDLPKVGEMINQMQWHAVELQGHKHKFLTSDRPVVMSDGLAKPHAHIVMPLTPDVMFVATKREEDRTRIHEMILKGEAVRTLNDRVVRQAHRFVYGQDDSQLRFVSNRVGAHFRSRD